MSAQPVFLQLNADDWQTCLDESLVFLRASWAQDWIGLPQILQACMAFLNLREIQLSAAASSMLAAAMDVASASELRFQAHNPLEEPHYHNRLHTADVVTTLSLLMAIEAKLSGKHEPDWLAAGLLAAVGHDFMHSIKPRHRCAQGVRVKPLGVATRRFWCRSALKASGRPVA